MSEAKTEDIIRGKRLLIVDDEKDVLDTLIEMLDVCKLDTASSFEEGKKMLENNYYDVAVLDIMGVRGYELLEIAKSKGVPGLMLTAHALSEEDLKKSVEMGASYYAPKDEMEHIGDFVADILEAKEKDKNVWQKWLDRLSGFYDKKFGGTDWREKEKEFWDQHFMGGF
ncbi:MAG: response regulator [Deltaproteobacteria bacterium]|nr:response regulator [Deltaproteobacteria bacterium]